MTPQVRNTATLLLKGVDVKRAVDISLLRIHHEDEDLIKYISKPQEQLREPLPKC